MIVLEVKNPDTGISFGSLVENVWMQSIHRQAAYNLYCNDQEPFKIDHAFQEVEDVNINFLSPHWFHHGYQGDNAAVNFPTKTYSSTEIVGASADHHSRAPGDPGERRPTASRLQWNAPCSTIGHLVLLQGDGLWVLSLAMTAEPSDWRYTYTRCKVYF